MRHLRTTIAALAVATLSGCTVLGAVLGVDAEKNQAARAAAGARFAKMPSGAITCKGQAQCEKAFRLARIYVSDTADMRIALNTDNLIQTYPSPSRDSERMSMTVNMVPMAGDESKIEMRAGCYHLQYPGDPSFQVCVDKVIAAFEGFAPFITSKL
jgi:hypothetical protein